MKLTIAWLYSDLMNTYGDRGNITCLVKRCVWRKILIDVQEISIFSSASKLKKCDLIFAGGAQDRQQKIIEKDLRNDKGKIIKTLINHGIPGLFICASYQLFGHRYQPAEGVDLEGLHVFDIETRHFGKEKPRCIGNIVARLPDDFFELEKPKHKTIVGFENHGGRTYLGNNVKALATVVAGYGNNGEDQTDGLLYNNAIGNYFHGPILPKNPHLADWLIRKALEVKYGRLIELKPLNDEIEWKAHEAILKKLHV